MSTYPGGSALGDAAGALRLYGKAAPPHRALLGHRRPLRGHSALTGDLNDVRLLLPRGAILAWKARQLWHPRPPFSSSLGPPASQTSYLQRASPWQARGWRNAKCRLRVSRGIWAVTQGGKSPLWTPGHGAPWHSAGSFAGSRPSPSWFAPCTFRALPGRVRRHPPQGCIWQSDLQSRRGLYNGKTRRQTPHQLLCASPTPLSKP
mmetsp:Transcript_69129/g.202427  ORF Transcript_69129/g.202427 Transcript_69129/m.202427 type:complete len:205 (+) Transcript_69129:1933-2547(+)